MRRQEWIAASNQRWCAHESPHILVIFPPIMQLTDLAALWKISSTQSLTQKTMALNFSATKPVYFAKRSSHT